MTMVITGLCSDKHASKFSCALMGSVAPSWVQLRPHSGSRFSSCALTKVQLRPHCVFFKWPYLIKFKHVSRFKALTPLLIDNSTASNKKNNRKCAGFLIGGMLKIEAVTSAMMSEGATAVAPSGCVVCVCCNSYAMT